MDAVGMGTVVGVAGKAEAVDVGSYVAVVVGVVQHCYIRDNYHCCLAASDGTAAADSCAVVEGVAAERY